MSTVGVWLHNPQWNLRLQALQYLFQSVDTTGNIFIDSGVKHRTAVFTHIVALDTFVQSEVTYCQHGLCTGTADLLLEVAFRLGVGQHRED